ncbi:MAG: MFS transporter [Candidatus Zhuqueibacterota bacterium]
MNSIGTSSSKAKITRNVIVLGLVSLFTDASSEMIYPLVPIFITFLGSGVFILGVIEGVAETTASLVKLFSGIISDKIRKRKLLIVIGYGVSTLFRPLTGMVTAGWQIVIIRMIDRIGKGIRSAPRDALIASSVDDRIRGKAYGFHRAMDHTGAVAGPLLALLCLVVLIIGFEMRDTLLTLRYTFLLALLPGLLAVIALVGFVREKVDSAPAAKINLSLKRFDKNFIAFLSIIVLFTLGNSSDAFLLFRVQHVIHESQTLHALVYSTPLIGDMISGIGPAEAQQKFIEILFIPLVWAFFHVIKAVFSMPMGALSDRIGRKRVITFGWAIYTFVYVSFALLDLLPGRLQIIATFVLFAIYALYYAFTEGAEKAFIADVVHPEVRGSAFGLYNFAIGLGALPASIIFGLIYQYYGAPVAFGTGAAIAGISMLLLSLFVSEKKPRAAAAQPS